MAWRVQNWLIDGELDNTVSGKVTGWIRFAGVDGKVLLDLAGDFRRDIHGTRIQLLGDSFPDAAKAAAYMKGFPTHHIGRTGDITAGLPPRDYGEFPYIEWYSDRAGRIVMELRPEQLEVMRQHPSR